MRSLRVVNWIWILSILVPSCAFAQACRDIATVDFRNSVIQAKPYSGRPFYGPFNGPGAGGDFRLRDGVFPEYEGFTPRELAALSVKERKEVTSKPDWETTIEHDEVWRPGGTSNLRVLVLSQVHLTGTGAFIYVLAFECNARAVRKVFEASGEGVKLERTTADGIDISVGVWGSGDGHCCPSRVVDLHYTWSPQKHQFIRKGSNAEVPWLP